MSEAGPRPGANDLAAARELLSATAISALAADHWERPRRWLDLPLLVAFVVLLALLFSPGSLRQHAVPPLDGIAGETVRAERDLLVEDKAATAERRERAAAEVQPLFDHDPDVFFGLGDQVLAAVRGMAARKREGLLDPGQRRVAFQQELGQPVRPATFELIEALPEPTDLAMALAFFLNFGLDRMVILDRSLLPAEGGLTVRSRRDGSHHALPDPGGIIDVAQLRRLMWARAGDAPYGEAKLVRSFILDTATAMARANLTANLAATESARQAAVAQAEPVYVRITAGEVVIREGDRVTAAVQERIRRLNEATVRRGQWADVLASVALPGALVLLAGCLWWHGRRRPSRRKVYMTLAATSASALICLAAVHGGSGVADGFGFAREAAKFLPPIAVAGFLISLLVGERVGLIVGMALALLLACRLEADALLATYFVVGILVSGLMARRIRRRGDLLRAGLAVGAAQALMVPVVLALGDQGWAASLPAGVLCALASGVLGAVAAIGLLPFFEHAFEATTDMRLIELASADNPLLKQLALQSPGTYYHSMMMGNLAEAAGDAIGANSLQCRVMALYHDIGKMLRPQYFAENQRGGNIHDRLPPEISARIIFAHIKEGIDLARKHRLGRPILDAITQHQGTTLLRVFYMKAVDRARSTGAAVEEAEFRYPGPRPQSREAAILMLADSVEAATRALTGPSEAELAERVRKVVSEKLADGQLDDSEITLRDLSAIEAAFVRVLTLGVYHQRIEYPPMPRPAAVDKANGNLEHRHHDRRQGMGERSA